MSNILKKIHREKEKAAKKELQKKVGLFTKLEDCCKFNKGNKRWIRKLKN